MALAIAAVVGGVLYGGWLVMLLVGIIYESFGLLSPISFWEAAATFLIAQAFWSIFTFPMRANTERMRRKQ